MLRGWAHYRQGSEDETSEAIALFEQAIALDPEYGRAHAAVAAASWRIVQAYWEVTTQGGYQRNFDRMQAALAKAMRQPNALAYTVSAEVLAKQGRYAEAFTEIDSAMALAPSNPDNYLSKARVLNATGRAAEAEESVRWAMRSDPLYSPEYLRVLATSLFNQQRYEEALGTTDRLAALKTYIADDYITLIASLGHLGRESRVPEAMKTFNELAVPAGYNTITVQMFGGWWWYGDIFKYDPAYRNRLIEGLRKAVFRRAQEPIYRLRRIAGCCKAAGATSALLARPRSIPRKQRRCTIAASSLSMCALSRASPAATFQAHSTLTSPPNCHGTACRASSARTRNSSCPVTARPAPTRPMPAPRP